MSGAAPDLIAGYLDELYARLRVPASEAELIAAETEDHLRETAAAGMAIGMTELEAQQAAIPVRAGPDNGPGAPPKDRHGWWPPWPRGSSPRC